MYPNVTALVVEMFDQRQLDLAVRKRRTVDFELAKRSLMQSLGSVEQSLREIATKQARQTEELAAKMVPLHDELRKLRKVLFDPDTDSKNKLRDQARHRPRTESGPEEMPPAP